MTDTTKQLSKLRELMRQHKVDAYVVPSDDQHSSEYVADCDKRRQWLTGFTGSAGTAVVTQDEALLFTDGRYHQQADRQLCSAWKLVPFGKPDVKNWNEHLATLDKCKIGIDPALFAMADYESIKPTLKEGSELVSVDDNLVDLTWPSRPKRPHSEVFVQEMKYAGQSAKDKISALRQIIKEKEATGIIVAMLDEVAWILNLRGTDIEYNPVFFSFLYIPLEDQPTLFINIEQLPQKVYEYVSAQGIRVEPYQDVVKFVKSVGQSLSSRRKVLVPKRTNFALSSALGLDNIVVLRSPVADIKAIKNPTEIQGFRDSHLRDGVALCRYFSWLERQLASGAQLKEADAATRLEEFRKELDLFRGLSFDTISSTGANASIIHYKPDTTNSAVIDKDKIYLCDSGAQFADGTTDTTRTLHFGTPTGEEKRAYTRVLQGHIAIDTAIFPSTVTGYQIDAFARRALWQDGLDYRHGTGHGIGSALNVHEGPQGIGARKIADEVRLQKGHVISNEPGYYKDGSFGIRIENVVVVNERERKDDTTFFEFEHVTMVPIATNLVDVDLLTRDERKWLNDYNAEVLQKVGPELEKTGDKEALAWLEKECKAI